MDTDTFIQEQAQRFSRMPEAEWRSLLRAADILIVRQAGYTLEGFLAFARVMMFDPFSKETIEPAPHHVEWARAMIDHKRLVILSPPESAKSTIISILFTAWNVGLRPWTQSIVTSVSDDQAQKIVGTIATYIEFHPAWKACFGDVVPDKSRGWGFDKGFFVKREGDYGKWLQERGTRKDPTLLGVGYQNRSIIGKRVDGVFVVDDIMDVSNSRSDAELEAAKEQFLKTISSRPTEDGRLVLVGTPWRDDDVYATALATGLYEKFITPAWTEVNGKFLSYWPSQWPVERLMKKRQELGERTFDLMYLMDLEAAKGTILKAEWLRPYFPPEQIDRTWPIYYGIDFAVTSVDQGLRGRGNSRSYFALAKLAIAPFGMVLLGGVRRQLSLFEAIELVKAQAEMDHPKKIGVESWGSGDLFLQTILREGLAARSYKDTHDKPLRFTRMALHFESGRVRVSGASNEFLKQFEDEWVSYGRPHYPNDTLDAVACAIDSAGYNLYAGNKLRPAEKKVLLPPQAEVGGWGHVGMPSSKFQGRP